MNDDVMKRTKSPGSSAIASINHQLCSGVMCMTWRVFYEYKSDIWAKHIKRD